MLPSNILPGSLEPGIIGSMLSLYLFSRLVLNSSSVSEILLEAAILYLKRRSPSLLCGYIIAHAGVVIFAVQFSITIVLCL